MENKVNKCHERASRLPHDDSGNLHFEELLDKGISVSIHQKNIQTLPTEIFKVKQVISPEIILDLLQFVKKPYKSRNNSMLQRKKDKIVYFALNLYHF